MDIQAVRQQFPALSKIVADQRAVFFDGPAGSQVPRSVIAAIVEYLSTCNANSHGDFETSMESDKVVDAARIAVADFLHAPDSDSVIFGPNMTTLTLAFSRALSRTWNPGDEIVVCRSEHDANFTPWILAARDVGIEVNEVGLRGPDDALDLEGLQEKISSRTRLVAIGAAGNALGSVQPLPEIIEIAHEAGARVFVDAVHYAPHRAIDVQAWDCDFLVCSAYKFFGPHVGILWGKRELLEDLPAYKVRPAPDDLPDRWMTGTQNFECIAGTGAAIDYLASLASGGSRRESLVAAFELIRTHENEMSRHFLSSLQGLPRYRVRGVSDPTRVEERVATFSFTHEAKTAEQISKSLAKRGIFSWWGNFYALPVTEALDLEPEGMTRVGFLHYNTVGEVDRLLAALQEIDAT